MPYPSTAEFRDQIAELVIQDHTQLEGEPLLLALYYASAVAPQDECLFEVISNFGYDEVSNDRHIFRIQFGPTANFPMPEGGRLRLVLTNPVECEAAISQDWEEVRDLRDAIRGGLYTVLYRDAHDGRAMRLLEALEGELVPA